MNWDTMKEFFADQYVPVQRHVGLQWGLGLVMVGLALVLMFRLYRRDLSQVTLKQLWSNFRVELGLGVLLVAATVGAFGIQFLDARANKRAEHAYITEQMAQVKIKGTGTVSADNRTINWTSVDAQGFQTKNQSERDLHVNILRDVTFDKMDQVKIGDRVTAHYNADRGEFIIDDIDRP